METRESEVIATGSDSTSKYYRKFFGFDPDHERILLQNGFKYEAFFPLENDPELHHARVSIGARVEVESNKTTPIIKNRIIFKRKSREACVNCVHTAICAIPVEDALDASAEKIVELAHSTESKPINLSPEDHFVSLKSYVEGIASLGIRQMIGIAYYNKDLYAENLPFGFNTLMQRQVISALRMVAYSATQALVREFIIGLAENAPKEWFNNRLPVIDEIYNLKEIILSDPQIFEIIDSSTQSLNLRVLAVSYKKTHPAITRFIARDPRYNEYRSKGALKETSAISPEYYFKIVILGGGDVARNAICNRFFERRFSGDTQLTIGASIGVRNISVQNNVHTRLIFYNLSDAERFRFIIPDFCRGSKAAIICYDVTDRRTFFEEVPKWLQIVRRHNDPSLQVFLLGYNWDAVEHQIDQETADQHAREWGCTQNIMISALLGYNIEETVQVVAEGALRATPF